MSATPRWPAVWSALRIVAAALIAAAIGAQASRTIGGIAVALGAVAALVIAVGRRRAVLEPA